MLLRLQISSSRDDKPGFIDLFCRYLKESDFCLFIAIYITPSPLVKSSLKTELYMPLNGSQYQVHNILQKTQIWTNACI